MDSENDIYDLVDQFENDLTGSYSGDEFYDKSVRILSEHGYVLEKESILEVHPDDDYAVSEYIEVIGEFSDKEHISSFVKFILEDSRQEDFKPEVEFVAELEDSTELARK